jgi:hypothetical protein
VAANAAASLVNGWAFNAPVRQRARAAVSEAEAMKTFSLPSQTDQTQLAMGAGIAVAEYVSKNSFGEQYTTGDDTYTARWALWRVLLTVFGGNWSVLGLDQFRDMNNAAIASAITVFDTFVANASSSIIVNNPKFTATSNLILPIIAEINDILQKLLGTGSLELLTTANMSTYSYNVFLAVTNNNLFSSNFKSSINTFTTIATNFIIYLSSPQDFPITYSDINRAKGLASSKVATDLVIINPNTFNTSVTYDNREHFFYSKISNIYATSIKDFYSQIYYMYKYSTQNNNYKQKLYDRLFFPYFNESLAVHHRAANELLIKYGEYATAISNLLNLFPAEYIRVYDTYNTAYNTRYNVSHTAVSTPTALVSYTQPSIPTTVVSSGRGGYVAPPPTALVSFTGVSTIDLSAFATSVTPLYTTAIALPNSISSGTLYNLNQRYIARYGLTSVTTPNQNTRATDKNDYELRQLTNFQINGGTRGAYLYALDAYYSAQDTYLNAAISSMPTLQQISSAQAATNGYIVKIDNNGYLTTVVPPSLGLEEITGFIFDTSDNMYVVDHFKNNLHKLLSPNYTISNTVSTGTNKPYGIAVFNNTVSVSFNTSYIKYGLRNIAAIEGPGSPNAPYVSAQSSINGSIVYLAQDGPSVLMIDVLGNARTFQGVISDFNPALWNTTYTKMNGQYILHFLTNPGIGTMFVNSATNLDITGICKVNNSDGTPTLYLSIDSTTNQIKVVIDLNSIAITYGSTSYLPLTNYNSLPEIITEQDRLNILNLISNQQINCSNVINAANYFSGSLQAVCDVAIASLQILNAAVQAKYPGTDAATRLATISNQSISNSNALIWYYYRANTIQTDIAPSLVSTGYVILMQVLNLVKCLVTRQFNPMLSSASTDPIYTRVNTTRGMSVISTSHLQYTYFPVDSHKIMSYNLTLSRAPKFLSYIVYNIGDFVTYDTNIYEMVENRLGAGFSPANSPQLWRFIRPQQDYGINGTQALAPYAFYGSSTSALTNPGALAYDKYGTLAFTQSGLHSICMIPTLLPQQFITGIRKVRIEPGVIGRTINYTRITGIGGTSNVFTSSESETPGSFTSAFSSAETTVAPYIQVINSDANFLQITSITVVSSSPDAVGMKILLFDANDTLISNRSVNYTVLTTGGCVLSYAALTASAS